MWGHPCKKLSYMGDDFGQWNEWNHDRSLDWRLLEHPLHSGLRRWVRDLKTFYRGQRKILMNLGHSDPCPMLMTEGRDRSVERATWTALPTDRNHSSRALRRPREFCPIRVK